MLLIARVSKMFGVEPADQLGIMPYETAMRMAINWACYLAEVTSQNEEYQKAQANHENEAFGITRMLEELQEQQSSRGN